MTTLTPQERNERIELYGRSVSDLETALKEFPREMWKHKPAPDSWSIHEQLIHLSDSETNSFARFRAAIATPGVRIFAYDQDVWANELFYHDQNTEDSIELLRFIHKMTYNLLKMLPLDGEVWLNKVDHPEIGIITLDDVLIIYSDHIPGHIQQMRECYEDWQSAKG